MKGTDMKKVDPQLLEKLSSSDDTTILRAIKNLRSDGHRNDLPALFQLLNDTGSEAVKKELLMFLSDIKDQTVVPVFLEALADNQLSGAHTLITCACWQSDLDFSKHTQTFINLFIDGDYQTAIEAFSVIEQSAESMDREEINYCRDQLTGKLENITEKKKALARELINILI